MAAVWRWHACGAMLEEVRGLIRRVNAGAGRAPRSSGARGMPHGAPTFWERHGVNKTPQLLPTEKDANLNQLKVVHLFVIFRARFTGSCGSYVRFPTLRGTPQAARADLRSSAAAILRSSTKR